MRFCRRPFEFAYLAQNGEVWPCGWMHYIIGNLYEQNLDEIWHSKAAENARKSILDGSFAYCRKQSCPFLERNELPDLTRQEVLAVSDVSEFPEILNIANDRICNIACTKCRTGLYQPKLNEREKIDGVLDRLVPYVNRVKSLSLNGSGEFLANPSFIRLLESISPQKKDFTLNLESNGILFDEAHWNRFSHLSKYTINITITLDSMRKEVFRFLTGGFDYLEKELSNLRFLSYLRRAEEINSLSVSMVVQECNFWEIPDYIHSLAFSEDYAIDGIIMKPYYNWWGMARETYWFKNILNPQHPYHQEYLKILADDCWNNPKVYDWGCHNVRESRPHPIYQKKQLSDLMLNLYHNSTGMEPSEYIRKCLERYGAKKIGLYGENEYYDTLVSLLRAAGADLVFRMTRYDDREDSPPVISMPHFCPDSVDTILLLELFDIQNRVNNIRQLKFTGNIITIKDLIEAIME